jgi:hypothetical protein
MPVVAAVREVPQHEFKKKYIYYCTPSEHILHVSSNFFSLSHSVEEVGSELYTVSKIPTLFIYRI